MALGSDTPARDARAVGLRYVTDGAPGIRRKRRGKTFTYTWPDGERVSDEETLGRIDAAVIPPAWHDVWICPKPDGHIQAVGRDDRGRKQYRYHPEWLALRERRKFEHLRDFGRALPRIRRRVERDLGRRGLPRERVLAAVVRVLDQTGLRVGNEEYVRENGSYGVTTLRTEHAKVQGSRVELRFRAKSGKVQRMALSDRRVARVLKGSAEIPGQHLFTYVDDDGEPQPVDSGAVNAYLRAISGREVTAKDFRTWNATVLAATALCGVERPASQAARKRCVAGVIAEVAAALGNRPAVCRKYYVHPHVLAAFGRGELHALWRDRRVAQARRKWLRREEVLVLRTLEHMADEP